MTTRQMMPSGVFKLLENMPVCPSKEIVVWRSAPACYMRSMDYLFSARCNIYISCFCYNVSVRLSVTEVHWRIIANLGFKFRSQFTTHCGRRAATAAVLLAGGSSRTMLASARSPVEFAGVSSSLRIHCTVVGCLLLYLLVVKTNASEVVNNYCVYAPSFRLFRDINQPVSRPTDTA